MEKPAQGPDTGNIAHEQALEELKLREMWAKQRLKLVERLTRQLSDKNATLEQALEELKLREMWAKQRLKLVERLIRQLSDKNAILEHTMQDLREEKGRSEQLLLNILPKEIASRLQAGESEIADIFPSITVLFADIVGFTELTERLGAKEIVRVLGEVFAIFDSHLETCNIEKIKTIGDGYMAAGGLSGESSEHHLQTANFALRIRDEFIVWSNQNDLGLQLRIGMHSGLAVAGIVGKQRFCYDIWGDVVNVASRMESTGRPGSIHVSESIHTLLQDSFVFEEVGGMQVKGKGLMHTWLLHSELSDSEAAAV